MKFKALIFSPEYLVVRRLAFETDDELSAFDHVAATMTERGWDDPEARIVLKEQPDDNNLSQGDR